ncbi:DUF4307 domain-containing protein [Luteococcus peritonei]|uniref:DUF4307 domain-containing protein n=1 Tax=Luteococcus peritonei TaxID=88874 RepID=A0ABW4RYY9_9ACTN
MSSPDDAQRILERYPVPPARHRLYLALVTVLALVLAGWLVWAGGHGSRTPVAADVHSFHVVDDNRIDADLRVQREDPTRPARCVLRATAENFVQVGELDAEIAPGTAQMERVVVPVRTIHRATTVEVISCRLA